MEQLQLSAPAILSLFETDKQQRSSFVQKLVEAIEDGDINPLEAHLQLKAMEDIISSLTNRDEAKNKLNYEYAKRYHRLLMDEVDKYGKAFEFHQSKITIGEVGTKYDYSVCNDPELTELQSRLDALSEQVKAKQKFLHTIPEEGLQKVTEDGEVITLYRPTKTSTTSLKVSLK